MLHSSGFENHIQLLVSMLPLASLAAFHSAALCFHWCLEHSINSVVHVMLNFGFCQWTVDDEQHTAIAPPLQTNLGNDP